MELYKIGDSSPEVTKGSRAEQYWEENGFAEYFKKVRPKIKLPAGFKTNDPNYIAEKFNLAGIGFGNWVTIEDKINYLISLSYAMYDLNKIMKMGYKLGLNMLTITFGARGSGGALAHYEPWSNYINISRYKDPFYTFFGEKITDKMIRFFATGGMGSLGHEYGHFIDYTFGEHVLFDKKLDTKALTGGRSIAKWRMHRESKNELLVAMDDLLEAIIWKVPGQRESNYYNRLVEAVDNGPQGEYWLRRNELFARAFEAFITFELKRSGIVNHLLSKQKYNIYLYLKPSELEAVAPKMRNVIALMKKQLK